MPQSGGPPGGPPFDIVAQSRITMQLFFIKTVLLTTILLLTTNYFQHVVIRTVIGIPAYTILYWDKMIDNDLTQIAFAGTLATMLIAEYSMRVNYRARAELFIESALNLQ